MKEFDIKVVDKLVRANVVAEFLSRLQVPDDPATIDDFFLGENIIYLIAHNL